jgi:hypothetical protein
MGPRQRRVEEEVSKARRGGPRRTISLERKWRAHAVSCAWLFHACRAFGAALTATSLSSGVKPLELGHWSFPGCWMLSLRSPDSSGLMLGTSYPCPSVSSVVRKISAFRFCFVRLLARDSSSFPLSTAPSTSRSPRDLTSVVRGCCRFQTAAAQVLCPSPPSPLPHRAGGDMEGRGEK